MLQTTLAAEWIMVLKSALLPRQSLPNIAVLISATFALQAIRLTGIHLLNFKEFPMSHVAASIGISQAMPLKKELKTVPHFKNRFLSDAVTLPLIILYRPALYASKAMIGSM
jgi:hypothetical protein